MTVDTEMKCLVPKVNNLSFVILYGSQLGQAKSIAEGLFEIASEHCLTTQVQSLNEIKDITELRNFDCPIVIVSSTTGDGEPPENADKFFRKLRKKNLSANTLNSVRYSILGLGDTNYNNFCNCAKTIHKRFQDLGATLFYPPAWADDAVGSDTTIDNWIEDLWLAIKTSIGIEIIDQLSIGERVVPFSLSKNSTIMTNELSSKDITSLTIPSCPQPFIDLKYLNDSHDTPKIDLISPPVPYPSIDGEHYVASMSKAKFLTSDTCSKKTLEVTLSLNTTNGYKNSDFDFEPGDAIGIVCPNSATEVNILLERLKLVSKSHQPLELNLKTDVKKKFPVHLPRKATLHDLFTHYVDIRRPPGKAFLRLLAEATENIEEKNVLLKWCSKEGGKQYETEVLFASLSLLDILLFTSSCHPSVESLLEHCPRLIPRAYSIASSPLESKNMFTLAFNIIEFPEAERRQSFRLGVCTGWLFKLAKESRLINLSQKENEMDLHKSMATMSITNGSEHHTDIIFYKRKNHYFRLPTDLEAPVIMVGPGTGVAPFVGFIEHRYHQKQNTSGIGPMTLYFGCRKKDDDFIYREKLEDWSSDVSKNHVLSELHVAFSRDPDYSSNPERKYVQDQMINNKERLVSELLENGGYFYVCGDEQNMSKDVREKLIWCIQSVKGLTEEEAKEQVTKLVSSKRYLQDVWI